MAIKWTDAQAGAYVRHLKRGSIFQIVGEVMLEWSGEDRRDLLDGEILVHYRDVQNGRSYARTMDEFCDGRFELVPPEEPVRPPMAHALYADEVAGLQRAAVDPEEVVPLRWTLDLPPQQRIQFPGVVEIGPTDPKGNPIAGARPITRPIFSASATIDPDTFKGTRVSKFSTPQQIADAVKTFASALLNVELRLLVKRSHLTPPARSRLGLEPTEEVTDAVNGSRVLSILSSLGEG